MIRQRPQHHSSGSSHHSTNSNTPNTATATTASTTTNNGGVGGAVPVSTTIDDSGNHPPTGGSPNTSVGCNHHHHTSTTTLSSSQVSQRRYCKQQRQSPQHHHHHHLKMYQHPPPILHRIRHFFYNYHPFTTSTSNSCSNSSHVILIIIICLFILFRILIPHHGIFISSSVLSHHLRFSGSTTSSTNSATSTSIAVTMDMKEYLQQPQNMLRPIDYQYYTIRINTWERLDQLQLSIQHHLSCTSVLQIQIVWCIDQTMAVPDWLIQLELTLEPIAVDVVTGESPKSYPRLVIERHEINSLNERFHPFSLTPPPTAAILSIDDDVLRPCLALDHTFYIWMRNPDRQVGFDARSHEVVDVHTKTNPKQDHQNPEDSPATPLQVEQQWKYSYMSVTEKTNLYSLTLTRYSFFHQHYMTLYMKQMPSIIRTTIDQNFNCEDIAMSMYISACHAQHKVPLLAHLWAVKSQIKMYVAKKISGTNNHKHIRDDCVHHFSQLLQLQNPSHPPRFQTVPLQLGTYFEYGDTPENWNDPNIPPRHEFSNAIQLAIVTVERWKGLSPPEFMTELKQHREDVIQPIYDAGYIEKTIPWQRKFSKNHNHNS